MEMECTPTVKSSKQPIPPLWRVHFTPKIGLYAHKEVKRNFTGTDRDNAIAHCLRVFPDSDIHDAWALEI